MKNREYRDYIQDIIGSINEIECFTRGISFKEFTGDRKTFNAVIRSIEVIGEASKKIPKNLREKFPTIPWKKMSGMRDKMIHEYFGIDEEILWKAAKDEIPPLKPLIQNVLKTIEGN